MKTLLILASFFVFSRAVKWDGLVARWALISDDPNRTDSFYDIPKNTSQALSEGWVQIAQFTGLNVQKFCLELDLRFCGLYDQQGTIAGFEVAVPAADVDDTGIPYNYTRFNVTRRITQFEEDYYATAVLLVDNATLAAGGRPYDGTPGNGIWYLEGGNLVQIPVNESLITNQTLYTVESCINSMGLHYYYNFSTELSCQDYFPLFLIVQNGTVIGVGFQTFGVATYDKRQWFEDIPISAIEVAAPTAPDCLTVLSSDYGIISLHTFFVSQPWTIVCPTKKD